MCISSGIMRILCVFMRISCVFHAYFMRFLCVFHAFSVRISCVFYAFSMRLHAYSMRIQCVFHAYSMRYLILYLLRIRLLAPSPQLCFLFIASQTDPDSVHGYEQGMMARANARRLRRSSGSKDAAAQTSMPLLAALALPIPCQGPPRARLWRNRFVRTETPTVDPHIDHWPG